MNQLIALNVFCRAVETGSFIGAARQMGLSSAAVSKNIGELEGHLGTRLFNRTTRRMNLTEAGSIYYDNISRILADLANADNELGTMQDTPHGLLRVSAPMTVTLVSLSEKIPEFLERYPDVSLDLHLDDRRVNIVEEGFDLAIRGTDNLEDSSLIARKLLTMGHVLCGAPSYFDRFGVPVSAEAIRDHRLVQFSLSDHTKKWHFRKGGRLVDISVKAPYRVSSSLAVRDALLQGFGISLIPRMYVQEDLASGRLVSVLDDWSADETNLYAVYPSKQYLTSKVRAFIDFLVIEFDHALQDVSK